MSKCRLEWLDENSITSVERGTTILQARIEAGLPADAPCGGNGSCGKCMVEIRADENQPWQKVKACQYAVESDLWIRARSDSDLRILTDSASSDPASAPEQSAADAACSVAFDIGTTSLVGYLLDARTGTEIAAEGMLNPQVKFGADVISRVAYAADHGPRPLTDCVRSALNMLIRSLCARAKIDPGCISAASIAGNTCMHHLFLGISPQSLGVAPYMPSVREAMVLAALDCGLEMAGEGRVLVLPVIAGFVGSDTVACMLAEGWQNKRRLSLLIDIGTNGELVMGDSRRMIACSTAAGPAFEGAKIQCGMRGTHGAIDRVWLESGEIKYHVIGETEPIGICGSGIVDLTAMLLEAGIIDETGRMEGREYRLSEKVVFTQKDVREVQLAKAAICAGIRLMARQLGIALEEIEDVLIAGAFGNYMNAGNACRIGMLPGELLPRIRGIGNAAGEGAKLALRDDESWKTAQQLAEKTEFLELASLREFQDEFVDALEFPEVEEC